MRSDGTDASAESLGLIDTCHGNPSAYLAGHQSTVTSANAGFQSLRKNGDLF
jgi:hypothetical protein